MKINIIVEGAPEEVVSAIKAGFGVEKQYYSKSSKAVCEHKNMSKNKFFSLSYGHCLDCGEEAVAWTD